MVLPVAIRKEDAYTISFGRKIKRFGHQKDLPGIGGREGFLSGHFALGSSEFAATRPARYR